MTYGVETYKWGIPINSGDSVTLSTKESNHFYIIVDWDMSEHETFYFSSPHLHNIDIENPERAFYRTKALLRLMNGFRELRNNPPILFDLRNVFYFGSSGDRKRFTIDRNTQLEYEELQNPFVDSKYLSDANSEQSSNACIDSNYEVDLFELAYKEELVKEVIILFSLSKIEPLYTLINTSKIIENIKFDLSIDKEKKADRVLSEVAKVLGDNYESFYTAYNFLTCNKGNGFQRFINTRDGSGIFARHGQKNEHYRNKKGEKLPIISFEEIKENVQTLIYEWINYKLLKTKEYRYPPVEKKTKIETLIDKNSLFDL